MNFLAVTSRQRPFRCVADEEHAIVYPAFSKSTDIVVEYALSRLRLRLDEGCLTCARLFENEIYISLSPTDP